MSTDKATGGEGLHPVLRLDLPVLALMVGGEWATEAATYWVERGISRYCPTYSLGIVPMRPHFSLAVTLALWNTVVWSVFLGMGSPATSH